MLANDHRQQLNRHRAIWSMRRVGFSSDSFDVNMIYSRVVFLHEIFFAHSCLYGQRKTGKLQIK